MPFPLFNIIKKKSAIGIPLDGLVAYYPLNGNANDASGNGNNGTVVGATFNAGEGKDGAYVFDGNDYINIDVTIDDLATTTQGTLSAWVKPVGATPSSYNGIIGFGDANAPEYVWIAIEQTTGVVYGNSRVASVGKWMIKTNSNPFSDNVWAYVVLVHNGTEPKIYINGVAVAQTFSLSTDKTVWFSGSPELDTGRIGDLNRNNFGEDLFFNGSIDEVAIYSRALSEAEILQIYNLNKAAFGH